MPYDEQKLLHFETSILTEASMKATEIEQEITEFTSSEIEKTRQEEYDKEFGFMQARVKSIKQNGKQIITKERLNSRRELLEFRSSLLEKTFDQAEKELEAFSRSDSYKDYLIKKIKQSAEAFPCENAVVYLRDADLKYSHIIKNILPKSEIESDDTIILGGYKIINSEKGLLLDESFESNLYKQRRGFYEQCGLTV